MTTEAGRAYFEGVQRGYTAPILRAAEAIPKIEAEAVAARNARIAEAVRGLPTRGIFGEGPGAEVVGRKAVLDLFEP